MLERGLVQVYTGNSRGFNFAPIGLTFRAAGQGLRSLITGFTPHPFMPELQTASSLLSPNLTLDYSLASGTGAGSSEVLQKVRVQTALKRSYDAVFSGRFDLVVLNGIHDVLSQGIIPLEGVMDLVEGKPSDVELVLSGGEAPEEIIHRADLVTHMKYTFQSERGGSEGGIEVVTGSGKGKTTYCLGKAMLTSCRGVETRILQFIKSPQAYGEVNAAKRMPGLSILSTGEGFVNWGPGTEGRKHQDAARKAWQVCLEEIYSLKYGMVVLDEINTATHFGLVDPGEVSELCSTKPDGMDLILSGRHAHAGVTKAANVLVEMSKIKHPYDKGIQARKGIEY